jgi:Fic family protein
MQQIILKKLPLTDEINQLYFINELLEAHSNIAKYQTLLNNSKISWNILKKPLLIQEAIQSIKINGTQTTINEVLEYELEENKKNNSAIEAINYYKALIHGEHELKKIPLNTRMFKELHKILFEGCATSPEPQLVNDYISNLEKYINEPTDNISPLIRIAIIHAQFETIHPFLDGNSRIGRILIPLYLYDNKFIDAPNFFISDTLEKDKHKYYKLLNDTRFKDNWNEWIKFFIESVNTQAIKNIDMLEKINTVYENDINKAKALIKNNNIITIIDMMYQNPIFNANKMAELTGIAGSTCRKYLNILEDANIIYSDNKPRNKTYYNYNLLDILR